MVDVNPRLRNHNRHKKDAFDNHVSLHIEVRVCWLVFAAVQPLGATHCATRLETTLEAKKRSRHKSSALQLILRLHNT